MHFISNPWYPRYPRFRPIGAGRGISTNPFYQFALQNRLTVVSRFDEQIRALDTELQHLTKQVAARDYALLLTVPGLGVQLAATLLYEIGDIARFPTVKDFLSYCRLVKATVASAGQINGLRGAKNERQQIQSQHGAGDQTGPGRLWLASRAPARLAVRRGHKSRNEE